MDEGFGHFYNLEFDQALADFDQAIAKDPNDPDLHNHAAEFWRPIALAVALGALMARAGFAWGAWMRKVRR